MPFATWTLTWDLGTVDEVEFVDPVVVDVVVEVAPDFARVVEVVVVVECEDAAGAAECERNATKVAPTNSTRMISITPSEG